MLIFNYCRRSALNLKNTPLVAEILLKLVINPKDYVN